MRPASTAQKSKVPEVISRSIFLALSLLTCGIVVLTALSAYYIWQQWAAEKADQYLTTTAQFQANNIQSHFLNSQALLQSALANINGTGMLDEAGQQQVLDALNETLESQTWFEHFLVVKPDGLILSATNAAWQGQTLPEELVENFSSSPTSLAVIRPPDLFANQGNLPPLLLLSSAASFQASGEIQAYLIGFYRPNFLENLLVASGPYTLDSHLITEKGDWFQVDQDQGLVMVTPSQSQTQEIETLLSNKSIDLPKVTSLLNPPVIKAAYRLDAPGLTWAIELPLIRSVPNWQNIQPSAIPFLAGIALIFALILLIPYWLLRPLRHIARKASSFADGNWEERAHISKKNEIGAIASAFNQLADELQQLSRRMDAQISDHNDKMLGLAKISQLSSYTPDQDEIIHPILLLTLKHFGYSYASFYQVIREGDGSSTAIFRQGAGAPEIEKEFIVNRISLEKTSESDSPIARAILLSRPQTSSKYRNDDLSPEHANQVFEAAIPLVVNGQAIACISVFSITSIRQALPLPTRSASYPEGLASLPGASQPTTPRATPFTTVKIAELQIVANQISMALRGLQNSSLVLASTIPSTSEAISAVFQAGTLIAQAETSEQVYSTLGSVLQKQKFASAVLIADGDTFQVIQKWSGRNELPGQIIRQLPGKNILPVSRRAVSSYFKSPVPVIANDIRITSLPQALIEIPKQMGCNSVAFIPVLRNELVTAILILGQSSKEQPALPSDRNREASFTQEMLQPYTYLIEAVTTSIEKIQAQENINQRLVELQTLWNISQTIIASTDLQPLYQTIHNQAEKVMGKLNSFAVLLYDNYSGLIQSHYMVEEGKYLEIEPFPLGEGLSSIVLRTGKPLLIVEDTERKAKELGAKTKGAFAKSWLGVPLQYGGESFGLIIVQDIYKEHRFSLEDQRLLSTIASQVAMVVRNVRLLETTQRQARLEKMLNEITGKIRRATSIENILQTSATELAHALNAHRAHIEIQAASPSNGHNKVEAPEIGVKYSLEKQL